MTAQPEPRWISEAEYWALNDESEHLKFEWYAGRIYAMAGGSLKHSLLSGAMTSILHRQRKGGCRVVAENLRVQVRESGLYTYPDVMVFCPPLHFHERRDDTLLNPGIIVEVLSKSTEAYDRNDKFDHYRTIESLHHYVLVSQDQPEVEVFSRQDNGEWLMHKASGLEASVTLSSMDATIDLAELYEDTDIGETPSVPTDEPPSVDSI